MKSNYKTFTEDLRFDGIPFRTFINDDADMVIRYNENNGDYSEAIYNGTGELIRCIDVINGETYIQE